MSEGGKSIVGKAGPKGPPPPPPPPPPYPHQKIFKKCKSATFQLDGATYTIECEDDISAMLNSGYLKLDL
ncbi:hypothetical protein KM043_013493 [Ampulex compressa]|nr:hypothetical protein KM043_013493 [Ampulex compressa]